LNFIAVNNKIRKALGFNNQEKVFPAVHLDTPFVLLTIGAGDMTPTFAFELRNVAQVEETSRYFNLSSSEIARVNPNTGTIPVFRSSADKELATKIYERIPVLIDQSGGASGNPWKTCLRTMFHKSNASKSGHLRSRLELTAGAEAGDQWLPVHEGEYGYQYDHRYATLDGEVVRRVTVREHQDQSFEPTFELLARKREFFAILSRWKVPISHDALLGFRRVSNAANERTAIAAILPPISLTYGWIVLLNLDCSQQAILCANFNSLIFDYLLRASLTQPSIPQSTFEQITTIPPPWYSTNGRKFVIYRVLELAYTSHTMEGFARSLGYGGQPFTWNLERRALLRAELDAYYAYLYGLTRRELEYVLDPKAVMGEDYPSETFRVLKESEIKEFGEYRTQRLVLQAWDRFAADGTFDPARLREPQYIDRLAQELTATRARLEQVEHDSKSLLALASATPKPTLFVEGVTDAKIIEASWAVFFPSEPMPVKVIAAGGTKEMGSLAGKGKALREVLGDKIVLVFADNDSAGRSLTEDGHVRKGGMWRQLPNGIHWCLLKPTADFAAAMKAHNVPIAYWPFTIEAAFLPALRRVAVAP
jgi:hypothetical protein